MISLTNEQKQSQWLLELKPYNHVQIICIKSEYLISYNCGGKIIIDIYF